MKVLKLDRSEVAVAIRDYIQKNNDSCGIEFPWGAMGMHVNDDEVSIEYITTQWPEERGN